jgi:hypothetical protein
MHQRDRQEQDYKNYYLDPGIQGLQKPFRARYLIGKYGPSEKMESIPQGMFQE